MPYRLHHFNEHFFDNIDSEEQAYWLGFISADASINKATYALCVRLAIRDRHHLVKLSAALDWSGPISQYRTSSGGKKTYEACCISVNSKTLAVALAGHGVHPAKSLTLRPWQGPTNLIRHYWRGVFDGDGSLMKKSARHWVASLCGSRPVTEGFLAFARDRVNTSAAIKPNARIFRVSFAGMAVPWKVTHALYQESRIHLDRKKRLADELLALSPDNLQRDWSFLTSEGLQERFERHGSWGTVARELNMSHSQLCNIRRRLVSAS